MDARRNQVYTGVYCYTDHRLDTVWEQDTMSIEALAEGLNCLDHEVIFLGDGVAVYREKLQELLTIPFSFAPAHVNRQRAAAVAALAEVYYKEGKIQTAEEHEPEYLRKSQAERERAEREVCEACRCAEKTEKRKRRANRSQLRESSRSTIWRQVMPIEEANFSYPWTETGFFTFLIRDDALFLVAEEDGEILGYLGILISFDESEITNVCVAEKARRRGIGRALMEELFRRMQERKVRVIHLDVRIGNTPARNLYESLGFVQDGLRKGYYDLPKEDAVLMSRTDESVPKR